LQEKDGLCHLLKDKETELEEVKQKLSRLQSDYVRDIREEKTILIKYLLLLSPIFYNYFEIVDQMLTLDFLSSIGR